MQVQLTDPRQSMKKGFVEFEVKSLSTIMKELKHSWIDVLKIDIEGAEWPVLKALIRSKKALPFTQLQVCALVHNWHLSLLAALLVVGDTHQVLR